MKVLSDKIAHKDKIGGVQLNLNSSQDVVSAIATMQRNLDSQPVKLDMREVLVEAMIDDSVCELIIGIKRHDELGLALLIGCGGVRVETQRSYSLVLLPSTRRGYEMALRRIALGLSPAAFDNVVAAMDCVAQFSLANTDKLAELDINPLIVRRDDTVVAVDALVVYGEHADGG